MFLFHQKKNQPKQQKLSLFCFMKNIFNCNCSLCNELCPPWQKQNRKKNPKNQLEATTNYDERRKIRARLRQVMADKEGIFDIKFLRIRSS